MAFMDFVLTDGTYSIDLVFDASSQTAYKLQQGMSLGGDEVLVTLHQGDFAAPVPLFGVDPIRTGFFSLDIKGSSADNTLNKEAILRRWLDGENQQALRYHTIGDVNKVYLKVRNRNATEYTYHDVLWGNVDSALAYNTTPNQRAGRAKDVTVQLYLEPTGYGDTITMRNDLANPAFLAPYSGGLAPNWNKSGTPTTSATSASLIGGAAQRVVAASDTHGIYSDTIANAAANDATAYAWVYVESGTVVIFIYDVTGAATLVSKTLDSTDSGGNSDRSAKDSLGNTWYRVSMSSGNFTAGNDCNFAIYASGGAATFNVDACYFEYNAETVVPEGWVSNHTIYGRMDQTNSNPERLNYIDVWGIPGDADADIRYQFTAGASSLGLGLVMARGIGNAIVPGLTSNQNHWLESSDGSTGGASNATWSTSANVAYSGGSVARLTATGAGGTGTITWTISGDSARRFITALRGVWVQMQAASTTPTLSFACTVGAADYAYSKTINPLAGGSTLHINSIGTLNGKNQLPASVPDDAKPDLSFVITIAGIPNGETVDIDGVWLLYADEEDYTVWTMLGSGFGNGDQFWVDGIQGGVINEASGVFEPQVLSTREWRVAPGHNHNRAIFLVIQNVTQFVVSIALDYSVTVVVRPRTRHLLGTFGVVTP